MVQRACRNVLLTCENVNCLPLFQRREARKQEQANNPFYIKASPSSQKVGNCKQTEAVVTLFRLLNHEYAMNL